MPRIRHRTGGCICWPENSKRWSQRHSHQIRFDISSREMPFANKLTKKNNIIETLFEDIRNMDKTWAISFVADAIRLKASAILAVGVFPCKGLSRARGSARENLKHKDLLLFVGSSSASSICWRKWQAPTSPSDTSSRMF